jgi:cytochrome P450
VFHHDLKKTELVKELLRLTTPSVQMWRIVIEDTNIGGVDIPAGATVMMRTTRIEIGSM